MAAPMANTAAKAAKWVMALVRQAAVPFAKTLQDHFSHATITALCECGCNSFQCEVQERPGLTPLFEVAPVENACVELVFASDVGDPITMIVHTDPRGLLAGMDVFLGIQEPVPDDASIGDLLFISATRARADRR